MNRTNHTTDEFDLINLQKLKPSRIVTDGDLDGISSAAILLRAFPDAEVIFAHPPGIRSGVFDKFIDKSTIICDLPFHPSAGAVIDHHLTNQISNSEVLDLWRPTMSAARITYSIVKTQHNLDDLDEFIEWVVVRPDGLINAEISNYEVVATPPKTIFNGLTTTRANVAHFMCECIEQPNLWIQWKGKMPVVYNKKIK